MKFRTTLILLVVLLAAALAFFLVERPRQTRIDEKAARERRLTAVSPEEVGGVTIERPDVTIEARREGEHWRIVAPVADAADDAAFHMLVRTICGAPVEARVDTDGSVLSEFGLDPPDAVVRLGAADGRALLEIRIGDDTVTKSSCYATEGPGRPVVLVPAGVRRYTLRPLVEFRSRRVVDLVLGEVVGVEVSSPGRSMAWRFDRAIHSWFTVVSGDTIRGDSTSVQAVVRELRGLRASDIPLDGAARRDEYLFPAAGSIVIETGSKPDTVRLRFGAAGDGVCYVENSLDGRISRVDSTVLGIFKRTVDELRDRRALRYTEDDLSRVTMESSGRTITLVRSGPRWTYANPGFGDISEGSAEKLFQSIRDLRYDTVIAERVPRGKDCGFSDPHFRLALLNQGGEVIDELRVGDLAPGGGSRFATSLSAPRLAAISEASLSAVQERFGPSGPR